MYSADARCRVISSGQSHQLSTGTVKSRRHQSAFLHQNLGGELGIMSYVEHRIPWKNSLSVKPLNLSVVGTEDLISELESLPIVNEKLRKAAQAYKDLLKGGKRLSPRP